MFDIKNLRKELQMDYVDMFGNAYQVLPKLNTYANNDNLYVGLDFFDQEFEYWAPYADVTVNVGSLPFLESAIDINNNGSKILSLLLDNDFGELTGRSIQSGFCTFPIFRFNANKLKEIDPVFFGKYAKAHGKTVEKCTLLNDQIADAKRTSGLFVFDDELLIGENYETLNGYLWALDGLVDRLTNPQEMENINFFADYNLQTGEIKLISTFDTPVADGECNKSIEVSLSEVEKAELISAMEHYCQSRYSGKSCLEFLNQERTMDGLKCIDVSEDKASLSRLIIDAKQKSDSFAQHTADLSVPER